LGVVGVLSLFTVLEQPMKDMMANASKYIIFFIYFLLIILLCEDNLYFLILFRFYNLITKLKTYKTMVYFKEAIPNNESKIIHIYRNITVDKMQDELEAIMLSLGYKHLGDGLFEKGSRVMRILFGAFCKYFKFRLLIESYNQDEVKVTVVKETTGISGGAIGVSQVKNEYYKISCALETI